jgi:peptidoglycan/xylan/chitin deacetylase (PgdA/CDA1 family)/GT2 family glycosyltransferase
VIQDKKLYHFSVIIPAYNEEYLLGSCLESLKNQDYPGKYEIIIVDNGSSDRTSEIARQYTGKIFSEPQKGISHALIKGCANAQGEIFAFTDADTLLPKDWLSKLNQFFNRDSSIIAIGGAYYFFDANVLVNSFSKFVTKFYAKYLFHPAKPGLPGVNMAIKKDAYFQVDGFVAGINYAQDTEISLRLAKIGKVAFDPGISVQTSFRRFSNGHVFFLWVYLNFLRKLIVQSYRLARLWSNAKIYSAEKPIRTKSPGRLKRILINGFGMLFILFLWVIYQATLNPTTQIFGSTIFHSNGKQMQIALTFDDGPYGEATCKILDILKTEHVKATFFVLGKNAKKYSKIIQREVNEGHTVGNHSFDHSRFLAIESNNKITQNITSADTAIFGQIGWHPKFFRPPYGIKSPWLIHDLSRLGYKVILWNNDVDDFNKNESAKIIVKRILKQVHQGDIIDLHDGRDTKENYPRENLITALPALIEGLEAKGYTLVTLDQLIQEQPYFNQHQSNIVPQKITVNQRNSAFFNL